LAKQCSQASPFVDNDQFSGSDENDAALFELRSFDIINVMMQCESSTSILLANILSNYSTGDAEDVQGSSILPFPEFIQPESVRAMGLALLQRDADSQKAFQYEVILNFKAALIIQAHQVQGKYDKSLRNHMERIQVQKLHAALAALDRIRFRTPPSLSLLQAQLIGVWRRCFAVLHPYLNCMLNITNCPRRS